MTSNWLCLAGLAALRWMPAALASLSIAYASDVCPSPTLDQSGSAPGLWWKSGTRQIEPEKICRQYRIASQSGTPVPVLWPSAGMLSAQIAGVFAVSYCCAERVKILTSSLAYGARKINTSHWIDITDRDRDHDYPDLIEPDAKRKSSSFVGDLWDGARSVHVDMTLLSSASHPYYKKSILSFVIEDQSSEPLEFDWNLVAKLLRSYVPQFDDRPKTEKYRKTTFVFQMQERPSPARGVIEIRTGQGKLLGRFSADGYTNGGGRDK